MNNAANKSFGFMMSDLGQMIGSHKIITGYRISYVIVVKRSQTVVKSSVRVKHRDLWHIIDQGPRRNYRLR